MIKVITYGTYDLLHFGHIRLLERAKALGNYLIVGVTADDFDKMRGKINVQQSFMERVEAVKATGLADEIIIEEYEGQKIDDIKKYDIDIFTVGSDWVGCFDYLNEYCKVVYLDRTQGVSSTELRAKECAIRLGIVGDSTIIRKFIKECSYVNGIKVTGIVTHTPSFFDGIAVGVPLFDSFESLVEEVDALYIISRPSEHYEQIRYALERNIHVIYESPVALSLEHAKKLFSYAEQHNVVLHAGIKTAYATAYERMILLAKTGKIGDIVSVDAVCTSLSDMSNMGEHAWNSLSAWGPTALLPVFDLLGIDYLSKQFISRFSDRKDDFDEFTKVSFIYSNAIASIKVGNGVKSEGELVISGTKGYIYVPSPWWKTEYYEIRYEDFTNNKRYFYQLDGEGIRYEIVAFVKSIQNKRINKISIEKSLAISRIMEDFQNGVDLYKI